MDWLIGFLVAGITVFAAWSGVREATLYQKYLKGETQYLVSKKRRNRRLMISVLLLAEAGFLFLGFFVLHFDKPFLALFFWFPPLILIIFLIYLSILDFRETSREIDHILREASENILKTAHERIASDKQNLRKSI